MAEDDNAADTCVGLPLEMLVPLTVQLLVLLAYQIGVRA
jgi:hypothetical protein